MPWYMKRFPHGRIQLSTHAGLEDFKDVFAAFAQRRPGATAFFRLEANGSATVYLTPACSEFAAMILAEEMVDAPSPDSLLLLY